MPIFYKDEASSEKGHKDKYSDETPKKDYADYKSDYPKDDARKISKEISMKIRAPEYIGIKSVEVKKQELISHVQNFQETFNNAERKAWKIKLKELSEAVA